MFPPGTYSPLYNTPPQSRHFPQQYPNHLVPDPPFYPRHSNNYQSFGSHRPVMHHFNQHGPHPNHFHQPMIPQLPTSAPANDNNDVSKYIFFLNDKGLFV